jgi:hypothetical protein
MKRTISPTPDESQSLVRIATDWEASRGLAGLIECLATPPILRSIYTKELRQLESYLRGKHTQLY